MAYASASDVAGLTRNLIAPGSTFTTSTSPTLASVNGWLSAGSALIDTRLASAGYGPIPAGNVAYDLAVQANAAFGAWWAERSRTNARVATNERTRADYFKKDFNDLMDVLLALDLSRGGVSQTSVAYAGGQSVADKDTVEADGDRVQPRFVRGMFENPEAPRPTAGQAGDPESRASDSS